LFFILCETTTNRHQSRATGAAGFTAGGAEDYECLSNNGVEEENSMRNINISVTELLLFPPSKISIKFHKFQHSQPLLIQQHPLSKSHRTPLLKT
jgi:hypothetical protein